MERALPSERHSSWIANLALALSSLILSLALAELGIRLLAPQPMSGTVFEYAPRGYSVNKSTGTALFSVGNRKGVYHFTPPHLRGTSTPPVGVERILILGDSFTFGVGLSEEETYLANLQKKIDALIGPNRVALLNAGIGGSGTAEHLAFIEDFANQIVPRAILVFVSFDDFGRAERSPLYRFRADDSLELDAATQQTSKLKRLVVGSEVYNFLIQHFHIAQFIRGAAIGIAFPPNQQKRLAEAIGPGKADASMADRVNSSTQQRLARALFRRMKAWCDAHAVKLAVINNGWRSYQWLTDLLAAEDIAAFDAAPQVQAIIAQGLDPYVIPEDGHPNPEGAALIAETVWPFLRSIVKDGKVIKQ
jgi:lysophospholipase L1-like esterase